MAASIPSDSQTTFPLFPNQHLPNNMASKNSALQGNKKGSASASSAAAMTPVVGVDYVYRIVWEKGPGGEQNGWGYGPPSPEWENRVEIKGKSTNGNTTIDCFATLHWRNADEINFSCVCDTKTGMLSEFQWTNKDDFGQGAGDSNEFIERVSLSMKGKSYNEAEGAAEKEVLDGSNNRFLCVVMGFTGESEVGMAYGKKVAHGAFEDCALSDKEKEMLGLH